MLSNLVSAWSYFVVCKVLVFATSEISISGHISPHLDALPAGRGTGLPIARHSYTEVNLSLSLRVVRDCLRAHCCTHCVD